jgi:putative SOS response-associated peptidase YedK
MCGRFTNSAKLEQIKTEFKVGTKNPNLFQPRYNIAPTQMIDVVFEPETERVLSQLKWGLVPSWAKDVEIGSRMINARAETITEKPSFREAFRQRRCVIPASGFYEWQKMERRAKQPYYFYLKDKEVFGFAGLWEEWLDKTHGELLETCTLITTEANEVLKPVHERMPVILKADNMLILRTLDIWHTIGTPKRKEHHF